MKPRSGNPNPHPLTLEDRKRGGLARKAVMSSEDYAKLGAMSGPPTLCDDERIAKIAGYMRAGHYFTTAVRLGGISHETAYNWMERGRKGEEPYRRFVEAIEEAEAEAENDAINDIKNARGGEGAAPWTNRAWFLERRHRDRWGRPAPQRQDGVGPNVVVIRLEGGTPRQLLELSGLQNVPLDVLEEDPMGMFKEPAAIEDKAAPRKTR